MTQQAMTKTQRGPGGRFAKGQSGNPAGRPRQASTLLREELKQHGSEVVGKVIEAAIAGDMAAAKMIIDRLCPALKPMATPVQIALPPDAGLAGVARAFVDAAASGELPSDQAAQLVQAVGSLARVVEIDELLKRIQRLETHTQIEDDGSNQWSP